MMRYISVDFETTGLDPNKNQVLEIAAVVAGGTFDDWPVKELPFFHSRVEHDFVTGNPIAMSMNADLLAKIAMREGTRPPLQVAYEFKNFLMLFADTYKQPKPRVNGAGKNFASFDLQFLRRFAPDAAKLFHHRCFDPAMLFIEPGDIVLPDMETCLKRAGLPSEIKHEALEDARNVVRLIRIGMARLPQAPSHSA